MTSLAEVKGISIRTRKDADNKKKLAADYERKAMLLLQKMQSGGIDPVDAERLATEAFEQEGTGRRRSRPPVPGSPSATKAWPSQLQANVNKIKSSITTYENDLVTLRARSKTAQSTKKINQQLAKIDSSGTLAMLEKMKAKVEEDESLAIAYGEMANADKSVDDEINSALLGAGNLGHFRQAAGAEEKDGDRIGRGDIVLLQDESRSLPRKIYEFIACEHIRNRCSRVFAGAFFLSLKSIFTQGSWGL